MKIIRKQELKVTDIQMGDQIVILLAGFGEFTATAQKVTEKGVLFMFDDCIANQPINERETNKGGYIQSYMKKWIDTVLMSAFPEELRGRIQDLTPPTYGQLFGHDDWYERALEPDDDEQLPLMKIRKNRIADYENVYAWYWLKNATKKSYSSACFAGVNGNGNCHHYHASSTYGVRVVFWLVK